MSDLRQALRTAVATPPPDQIDLVAVVASGRRTRDRRRWRVAAIAATTAAVTVAAVSVVALVTRDGDDRGEPQPASTDGTRRTEATDPVDPPRDFAADPVLDFEPDAPLLRDGDVVLGGPEDDLEYGYLTEDLQVLVGGPYGDGRRFGLVDPTASGEIDWLPIDPAHADDDVLPLCGFLVRPLGDCVQGTRSLWFYVWVGESGQRINVLRFDRVTREWSEAGRPPPTTTPQVSARLIDDGRRLVVDGAEGRHVVALGRLCARPEAQLLWEDPDRRARASAEGKVVVVDYQCTPDEQARRLGAEAELATAVLDARGRMLLRRDEGVSTEPSVVDEAFVTYAGMLVDLDGGRVYRLLRAEPHRLGPTGWESAYSFVAAVRGGLVSWAEVHPTGDPADPDFETTLHLTPLPGG